VYTIAYRVHVYTDTSQIHSPNLNADSSNRISSKYSRFFIQTTTITMMMISRTTTAPTTPPMSARLVDSLSTDAGLDDVEPDFVPTHACITYATKFERCLLDAQLTDYGVTQKSVHWPIISFKNAPKGKHLRLCYKH